DRDHGRVRQRAAAEDAYVRGPAADVDEHGGQLLLARVKDREPGGQRLDDQPVYVHAGVNGAALEVLKRTLRSGDDVDVDLEPHARHALGVRDAVVAVHHVLLRDDVEDLHVLFEGDGLGVLDRAFDVRARDLLAATDRRHAMAGHGLEVAACDTYPCGPHLDACHALSVRYRLLDGHYGA